MKLVLSHAVLGLFLALSFSSAAFADGEDDNCSAAEGWPKPAHCDRTRFPDGRVGPVKPEQLPKVLCSEAAADSGAAVTDLNERLTKKYIPDEKRNRDFYFSNVSAPSFSKAGNEYIVCVTVFGNYITRVPGQR